MVPDGLGSMFGDPQSLIFSVLVFAGVFIVVAAAGLHLSRPPKLLDGKAFPKSRWRMPGNRRQARADQPEAAPLASDAPAPPRASDPIADFKKSLLVVYRVLSFILVASLAGLTIALWFATDPNDGSRLAPIVFGAGTLALALHLMAIDRRHRPARGGLAPTAGPAPDLRTQLASKLGAALLGGAKIDWQIASPEVYSIDQAGLDRARAMAAEGRPIDEICRMISPDYDSWGSAHQQAYRAVVQAAIEHRG